MQTDESKSRDSRKYNIGCAAAAVLVVVLFSLLIGMAFGTGKSVYGGVHNIACAGIIIENGETIHSELVKSTHWNGSALEICQKALGPSTQVTMAILISPLGEIEDCHDVVSEERTCPIEGFSDIVN